MIGEDIVVTVMEVSASTVRLGIAAPQGVSIFREEIWLAVKEENRAAAAAAADALPSEPIGEAISGGREAEQGAPPRAEQGAPAEAEKDAQLEEREPPEG